PYVPASIRRHLACPMGAASRSPSGPLVAFLLRRKWEKYRDSLIMYQREKSNPLFLFACMNREDAMSLVIEPIPSHETLFLLPMLLDADEGEERIHAVLLDPACTAYASWLDGQLVGAAVVRWEEQD